MITLAEILSILLPPILEKAQELHAKGASGALSTEQVRAEVEALRDAVSRARADDEAIDGRIDGVR